MQRGRILICVGVTVGCLLVALAVGVVRWFQFVPLLAFQNENALYVVPEPVPHRPVPPKVRKGTEFQAFGYLFDLPWQPISEEIRNEHLAGLIFETGQIFLFYNPDATVGWLDEFRQPENEFVLTRLENAFGKRCCSSDFDIVTLILNATPERVSFFRSFERNSADALLLSYKRIYLNQKRRRLTFFQYHNFSGYQIGETTDAAPVRLLIFTVNNDELKVDIGGLGRAIPQAEIDAVLTGFRFESPGRNSN